MSVEVFISYSSQDYDRVMPLVDRLRSAGAAVWVDEGNIDAATLWSESIVKAINECRVLIMMVSSHSTDSHNVVKEVMIASEGKKTILPIYLEPAEIPAKLKYQLTGIQHLEWFDSDNEDVFETLKEALAKRGVCITGKVSANVSIDQTSEKRSRKPSRLLSRQRSPSSPARYVGLIATLLTCFLLLGLLIAKKDKQLDKTVLNEPIHLPVNLSNGEKVAVRIYYNVGSLRSRANIGKAYIGMYDASDDSLWGSLEAVVNGSVSFTATDVAPGNYYILTSTDIDNDNTVCDYGELCEYYPKLGETTYYFTVSDSNLTDYEIFLHLPNYKNPLQHRAG